MHHVKVARIVIVLLLSLLVTPVIAFAAVAGGDTTMRGLVAARPADGEIGSWQIGDLGFEVNVSTKLGEPIDRLALNYCVELKYRVVESVAVASELKPKDRKDCEPIVKTRGAIDTLPASAELTGVWQIAGSGYLIDLNTELKDDRGPFAANVCVEITYGSITAIATKVETRQASDCPPPQPQPAGEQRLTALIADRPDGTLIGAWTIGTLDVAVTAATDIEGDAADLIVNYCAELRYLVADGSATAVRLKAKDRTACESLIRLRAAIDVLPATPELTGTWIISGSSYLVDSQTELKDDRAPFAAGVCVEITYGNRSALATKVESRRASDCGLPDAGQILKTQALIDARPATAPLGIWTIGGSDYVVLPTTQVDGLDRLNPLACAEVEYSSDGSSNTALKLRSKPRSACETILRLIGPVDVLPATAGLTGTWLISATALTADDLTDIHGRIGDYSSGTCVEARYGETTAIMTKVERKDPTACASLPDAPETGELRGLINARPAATLTGTWTISGTQFAADGETALRGDQDQLQVGYCAKVRYFVGDGGHVATEIKSESRDHCEPIAELTGQITLLPATSGLTGTWLISGTSVVVDGNTRLRAAEGPFAVAACVKAKYGQTTTIALEIRSEKGERCGISSGPPAPVVERAYGSIEAFPITLTGTWTINGAIYTATTTTAFKTKEGPLALGACARVDYVVADGSAIQIASAETYHCTADGSGGHSDKDARRYGLVESFPATLYGTWVIDGESYQAGLGTRFKQEDGGYALNSCVEIKYLLTTQVALAIEMENTQHCGAEGPNTGSFAEYNGTLIEAPATVTGTWTVDDRSFTADATTTLIEGWGALVPDACVKVVYQTSNDLALSIESQELYYCGGSVTPPADPEPRLTSNADTAGNGGGFVFTAAGLDRNTVATVAVNGTFVGTAWTNSEGRLTFGLYGALYGPTDGRAALTTLETVVTTAETTLTDNVTIDPLRDANPLPAGYSAPVFNPTGPSGPTAVLLAGGVANAADAAGLLSATLLTLLALTGIALLRRRRS